MADCRHRGCEAHNYCVEEYNPYAPGGRYSPSNRYQDSPRFNGDLAPAEDYDQSKANYSG